MKIVENRFLPPKRFLAINIFGMMFVRRGNKKLVDKRTIRHETIHTRQMIELLVIPFYLWYGIEWLIKLPKYGMKNAYYNLSFEREAYENHNDINYLNNRKLFSFLKYI
ncbi:MAG: hypothetical protein FWC41_07500 [Firmicutes bacterium]|nr:hypothetical protein [Bacillota bacterium]